MVAAGKGDEVLFRWKLPDTTATSHAVTLSLHMLLSWCSWAASTRPNCEQDEYQVALLILVLSQHFIDATAVLNAGGMFVAFELYCRELPLVGPATGMVLPSLLGAFCRCLPWREMMTCSALTCHYFNYRWHGDWHSKESNEVCNEA
jgi:hypothetical protein